MKMQWLLIVCFAFYEKASCQELEARAYANLPKNMNATAVVYNLIKGNVIDDPSLPITDFKITAHNIAAGYVRTFALARKLARVQLTMPFVSMTGKAKITGQDTTATRTGFGDMRLRLGINLIGSPALDRKDFNRYSQVTIVGLSFVTSIPTGQYYKDKKINIGSNRWAFKPEVGASRRFKHVYAEIYMGVWFYAVNNDYLGAKELEQQPVFSTQFHAVYNFKNSMTAGIDANWYNGGKTFINNNPYGELMDNSRIGITWTVPIAKQHLLKLQLHTGVYANTGLDYTLASLGYQYVFF